MQQRLVALVGFLALVIHVPCANAQGAPTTWKATPLWRIDGTESGEPFSDLRDYVVGPDGVMWVLDSKDQVIRRFDASGRALPSAGRKGSGPGEMSNANGIVMRRDGSVWVNDPRNSRLTVFGADGKFSRQHTWSIQSWGYRWGAWVDRTNGDLIDPFSHRRGTASVHEWRRVSVDGAIRDTIAIPTCPSPGAPPVYVPFTAETKGQAFMTSSYPFTTGVGQRPMVRAAYGVPDRCQRTSCACELAPMTPRRKRP